MADNLFVSHEDKQQESARKKQEQLKAGTVEDLFEKLSFRSVEEKQQHDLADCGLVEPLHRMYLVGAHEFSKREQVFEAMEVAVEQIQGHVMDDSSKLTGLLIVDKIMFCHIVEGASDVIDEIVERTDRLVDTGIVSGAKVITTIFEIAGRQFDRWFNTLLEAARDMPVLWVPRPRNEEGEVHVIVRNIRKFKDKIFYIAQYVCHLKKEEFSEKLNSLTPWHILPLEEELRDLYEDPFFLTVKEHVQRYLLQRQIYIHSEEQEWPPVDRSEVFEYLAREERKVDIELDREDRKEKDRFEKEDSKKEPHKKKESSDEDD